MCCAHITSINLLNRISITNRLKLLKSDLARPFMMNSLELEYSSRYE